jgi:hypothetical protein
MLAELKEFIYNDSSLIRELGMESILLDWVSLGMLHHYCRAMFSATGAGVFSVADYATLSKYRQLAGELLSAMMQDTTHARLYALVAEALE